MNRKHRLSTECIDVGEEEKLFIEGFKSTNIGVLIYIILIVISGGILLLVMAWKPSVKTRITSRRCTLDQANTVILRVLIQYQPFLSIININLILI